MFSHSNSLLDWTRYSTLLANMEGWFNQPINSEEHFLQGLENYSELLALRDEGFPFLLLQGESHTCESVPFGAYLLPPLKQSLGRWLLLLFTTEDGGFQVQIVDWTVTETNNILRPLNSPQTIDTYPLRILPYYRPLRIEFKELTGRCYVQAIFLEGTLDLIANSSKGIITSAWTKETSQSPCRVERCSFDGMNDTVQIEQHENDKWRDNSVFDEFGNSLIPNGFKPGWINGADSPSDQPDWVYLASSQTRVFRLDKKQPHQVPWQSSKMPGMVLDVLTVQDNSPVNIKIDKAYAVGHGVLAATQNGKIYFLKANPNNKTLKIQYWQPTGEHHIVRLIGFGESAVLAIDERGEIIPLRMSDPYYFNNIRKQVTQRLVNYFFSNSKFSLHQLIKDGWLENNADKFRHLARLALEYFLLEVHEPPINHSQPMSDWCEWLHKQHPEFSSLQRAVHAKIHAELICRIMRWMQQTTLTENSVLQRLLELSIEELNLLFKLITPNDSAPDYIWLALLRNADWVRLWGERTNLVEREEFSDNLQVWEIKLQNMRIQFLDGLAHNRPLATSSSLRLYSHANHIEVIDDEQRLVAVSEYAWGVRIYRLHDKPERWELRAEIPANELAEGQILFLRALPQLRMGSNSLAILLGTVRGELVLLVYDDLQKSLKRQGKAIACNASIICSRDAPNHRGVLLGGRSLSLGGCAVLYAWTYQKLLQCLAGSNQGPTLIWKDPNRKSGALRLLRLSRDGKRLWAINREQGCLYTWQVPPGLIENASRLTLPDPEIVHQTINKLHALDYSAAQNLLVCGGSGGMTAAFDDEGGDCRWVVNGSGDMRRVRYLPYYPTPEQTGAWLLCGHYQSSLIVDSEAKVVGVLERAGPVSSVTVIAPFRNTPAKLVLGTLEGRLMVMNIYQPKPELVRQQPWLADDAAAYPVRLTKQLNNQVFLMAMLDTPIDGDSLCNMRVLRLSVDYLRQQNTEAVVRNKMTGFFLNQPLERQVVFLYWLREGCLSYPDKNDLQIFASHLVQQVNIKKHEKSGLLCKLLSPIFDMLDIYKERDNQSRVFREQLSDYVWHEPSTYASHMHSSALAATRLNQAAKRWGTIYRKNKSSAVPDILFSWCNAMAKECCAKNVIELQACLFKLTELQISFLSSNSPWRGWLPTLIKQGERVTPEPLSFLETPRDTPLSVSQFEQLKNIFTENTAWKQWLLHFQDLLIGLQQVSTEQPHRAWNEQTCLEGLSDWILSIGKHRFSVEQEQALVALWWWKVEKAWEDYIDAKRRSLYCGWVSHRDDYLCLSEVTDRWQDKCRVFLRLTLVNRCPEELHIDQVSWEHKCTNEKQLIDAEPKLPILLKASDEMAELSIFLNADHSEHLNGELTLSFKGVDTGDTFTISYKIEKRRNIARLSEEKQWHSTWDRLNLLLSNWRNENKHFYWLEGDVWTPNERNRLAVELEAKYAYKIEPIKPENLQAELKSNADVQFFSPDLALGATPQKQLEQLHEIIATLGESVAPFWLLGLWSLSHPIPERVRAALNEGKRLPDVKTVKIFLQRLGLVETKHFESVLAVLAALPFQALGAWCEPEPFYTAVLDTADSKEIYLPPAASLPQDWWRFFDQAAVSSQNLADFTGISTEMANELRQAREAIYVAEPYLFDGQRPELNSVLEKAATALLKPLGMQGHVSVSNGVWWFHSRITLNWNDFGYCLLLPKASAEARAKALDWAKILVPSEHIKQKLLWLCLSEIETPDEWPGLAIGLKLNDVLSLVHAEDKAQAQRLLNKIYARQSKPVAEQVFQSIGGLGTERVAKHFGGRTDELKKLLNYLTDADRGGRCSALIVGGRRMGKTTLRERIQFEVDLESTEKKRVCLTLNWEGIGDTPNRRGVGLEYWFMRHLKKQFLKQHQIVFELGWSSKLRTNQTARESARTQLQNLLDKLKQKSGHTPLFIFDETENLVRLDAPTVNPSEPWSLFKFLRELINEKKLCLFATSYPHGLDMPEAINVASFDSNSPLANTFPYPPIAIGAWTTETAWDYLYQKMSGLGLVLPYRYRDEYLNIGRGVPWIAHAFGLSLCESLPKGQRIVDPQTWQQAKLAVLEEIFNILKVPVIRLANELDAHRKDDAIGQGEIILGDGRLWQAFRLLAGSQTFVHGVDLHDWPPAMCFTRQDLQERLPDVESKTVREILRRLSSSPVLEGVVNQESEFIFANNLLPAWLYYSNGKES